MQNLPFIGDVFTALCYTREFTYKGLRSGYRQEFGRLCARVMQYNREDAWDHLAEEGGRPDTAEMQRCRVDWTELSMFAKCVLRV